MDLPEAEANWPKVEAELTKRGYEVMSLSAATQLHTRELVNRVAALLAAQPDKSAIAEEMPIYGLKENEEAIFTITRDDSGAYVVRGKRIERAAAMTYWEFDELVQRFQKILEALGITAALEKAGVGVGDTVFIGDYELEWGE